MKSALNRAHMCHSGVFGNGLSIKSQGCQDHLGTSEQNGIIWDMNQRTNSYDYFYHLFFRVDFRDIKRVLSHGGLSSDGWFNALLASS